MNQDTKSKLDLININSPHRDAFYNRLKHLGLDKMLFHDDIQDIIDNGFPFKYNSLLDEAILILHYFLKKQCDNPKSEIRIHCVHVPAKEEENSLSFWRSAKAGLYLDLQNIIILNNNKNTISRLFVFRNKTQFSQLESTGISVILEQENIKIKTGFIIVEDYSRIHGIQNLSSLKNILIVELKNGDQTEWAILFDSTTSDSVPYRGNDMFCKFDNKLKFPWGNENFKIGLKAEINLKQLKVLFEIIDREFTISPLTDSILLSRFPSNLDSFRDLLKKNLPRGIEPSKYEESLILTRIPYNIQNLSTALARILNPPVDVDSIFAIDATSVKNTLKIHETDANYRNWIRTTLTFVNTNKGKLLKRIYIIDSEESKRNTEFDCFINEINDYKVFIDKYSPSTEKIWELGFDKLTRKKNESSIQIKILPSGTIEDIIRFIYLHDQELYGYIVDDIRSIYQAQKNINTDTSYLDGVITKLIKMDYLFTNHIIYNYIDPVGEPSSFYFDAYLYEITTSPPIQDPNNKHYICYQKRDFQNLLSSFDRLFNLLDTIGFYYFEVIAGKRKYYVSEDIIDNIIKKLKNRQTKSGLVLLEKIQNIYEDKYGSKNKKL
jgi:hypothetical protein